MNEPYSHDRLLQQITESTETLAACERNMRTAHALLEAAHVQIERSRDLHRQLDLVDQRSHPGLLRHEMRPQIDEP